MKLKPTVLLTEQPVFVPRSLVQIRSSDAIGRVIGTDGSAIQVSLFGEEGSIWGETNNVQSFSSECLQLLTAPPRFDFDGLESKLIKVLGGIEISQDIATKQIANDDGDANEALGQIELISSTFADVLCDIIDEVGRAKEE